MRYFSKYITDNSLILAHEARPND